MAADWAIESPARNRAAPAQARAKRGYAVSANPTLTAYFQHHSPI